MTKEITKAIILQEMQDKLKLREFEPSSFLFSETVIPTYNIGQHLGRWEVQKATESIASTDHKEFFTVPANERWTLRAYMLIFGATGAHKASGVTILYRPTNVDFIYLDLKKGQEVSYLNNLPFPVVLTPGNQIGVYIDTYVSTQSLSLYIDTLREEIR